MKTSDLLINDFIAGFASIAGRQPLIGTDFIAHLLAHSGSKSVYQCGRDYAEALQKDGWDFSEPARN